MRKGSDLGLLRQYVPTDVRYYVKGGGYLLTNQAASTVLGAVNAYVLGNWVSPSVYGAYSYVTSVLGMMVLFTLPGINSSIVRSVAHGYEGSLVLGTKRRLRSSCLGAAALLALGSLLALQGRQEQGYGLAASAILFPFAYSTNGYLAYLQGKKRFVHYTICNLCVSAAITTATVVVALVVQQFLPILLANLFVTAAANTLCLLVVSRRIENREVDEGFVKFGTRLSILSVLGSVSSYADRVIIGTVTDMESLASYNLSRVLTDLIRSLGVVLNALSFPKMVTIERERLARILGRRLILLSVGLVGVAALSTWLLPAVIALLFPMYVQAIPFVRFMTVSASLTVLAIVLETFFLSQEELHWVFYAQRVAFPAAELLLMLLLIERFQIYGVIFSRLGVRLLDVILLSLTLVWVAHPRALPGGD
ncbi:MAG: oligosaccharide flippase family protein [Anaerolineae bacterium]|nr:oligosaccharide flippase family protein [Anaerolineae bacterium]